MTTFVISQFKQRKVKDNYLSIMNITKKYYLRKSLNDFAIYAIVYCLGVKRIYGRIM